MAGQTPEKGDEVSWSWGDAQPSGEVAEKKTEGEASVTSVKGNVIRESAEPGNPALVIERSGNDVVKKASELNVEGAGQAPRSPGKQTNGTKRARDETEDEKEEPKKEAKRARGRPKGSGTPAKKEAAASKKGAVAKKTAPGKETAKKENGAGPAKRGRKPKEDAAKAKKEPTLGPDGKPRGRGRPPKDPSAEKKPAPAKKAAAPKKPVKQGVRSSTRNK